MRYDDWDVILFPKDSPVPVQEFKTACYHAQDTSKSPHLPLLRRSVTNDTDSQKPTKHQR
jgi:hypothetical protein